MLQDHPHVCGEYTTTTSRTAKAIGITPTCVGNTVGRARKGRGMRDHPHVCGEYTAEDRFQLRQGGSPPRVWGIHQQMVMARTMGLDHPHVCGEYKVELNSGGRTVGSPPRVWGIRLNTVMGDSFVRITPTCVGNTERVGCRVGGGYGSPPRVWGIRTRSSWRSCFFRITPTCVGNTGSGSLLWRPSWDHPHVCGDTPHTSPPACRPLGSPPRVWGHSTPSSESNKSGSPPRVWGIRVLGPPRTGSRGITPTCVGNTETSLATLFSLWDHPHVCGEYAGAVSSFPNATGSPPRVWGIRLVPWWLDDVHGITPTCVGNTNSIKPAMSLALGSPPRVWGIPSSSCAGPAPPGITPTCVGNTWNLDDIEKASEDHPHVCGEYYAHDA